MIGNHKTMKSMAGFKTQKIIRHEHLKEDFFQHILKEANEDLSTEEYGFLVDYLLPEKYNSKEDKTVVESSNKLEKY